MTPSSTPGSPVSDDPMPWSDHDAHGSAGATRPMPPVSRIPDERDSDDTAPVPGGSHESASPHERTADDGAEDWDWYDGDDAEHTRPMPAVTAQRPVQEDTGPVGPAGDHGPADGYGPAGSHVPAGSHSPVSGYGPAAGGYPPAGDYGPAGSHGAAPGPYATPSDPATRLARQREEFGGLQLIPGFFGWLSALALTWLLLALAGLVASALGLRLADGLGGVVDELASGSAAAWTAAAVLGVVEFLAFLGGGYTAGRMARFSGAGQGVSVWLWSLFGRSVATVAGLVWADTVGLAPVGVSAQALIGSLLVPGLLAVAAVLVVDLLGALLGGLWGIRYHRRVDRWDAIQR